MTLDQQGIILAVEEAVQQIQQDLVKHAYISYREEKGIKILEILSAPGTPAALALTAAQDGTITATRNGIAVDTKLNPSKHETEALATTETATLIAKKTLKLLAHNPIPPELITSEKTQKQIAHAADRILSQAKDRNSLPAWLDSRRGRTGTQDPQYIIENTLTNHDNWLLLNHIMPSYEGHTVDQYNLIARNSTVFKQMETKESPPLHFYCNRIAPTETEQITFDHPGQVITLVREHLGLPQPLWKVFRRIPHGAWPHKETITMETIAKVCKILHAANVPKYDPESLPVIIQILARPDTNPSAEWNHGNAEQAWANLARAYLSLNLVRHSFYQSPYDVELPRIADAIRSTIREDHPWGAGNWDTLRRRSEHWHEYTAQQTTIRDQAQRETLAKQTWESVVEGTTIGDFTFTAVTDGNTLTELGKTMHNCLGTYVHTCTKGHTRIFTVHRDEKLLAAVEIYQQDGQWLPGQAEGPRHQKPPKGVTTHLKTLAQAYQKEEKSRTKPCP